jgi:predicted peroxiredoxin
MKQMNQQNVLNIVHQMEALLVDGEADYPDAMAAALYVAAVSANNMGMDERVFLLNCKTIFDHDKKEQLKELQ